MRLMPRFVSVLITFIALSGPLSLRALAEEGPLDPAPPKGTTMDEVIRHFAAKEKEFKAARDQYTYRQSVKVQTLDGDTVEAMTPP